MKFKKEAVVKVESSENDNGKSNSDESSKERSSSCEEKYDDTVLIRRVSSHHRLVAEIRFSSTLGTSRIKLNTRTLRETPE